MTWLMLADASTTIVNNAKASCGTACGNASLTGLFKNIANTLVYIVGAAAVLMIIIGGLRYVLANGDAKAAAEAKQTIMYSVIGVVVAIMSFAIVKFVATSLK